MPFLARVGNELGLFVKSPNIKEIGGLFAIIAALSIYRNCKISHHLTALRLLAFWISRKSSENNHLIHIVSLLDFA